MKSWYRRSKDIETKDGTIVRVWITVFETDDYSLSEESVEWCREKLDAVPVRHGMFIGTESDGYADGNPVYYEWKCSECGCIFEEEEPTYRYCPNCGARMDEAIHSIIESEPVVDAIPVAFLDMIRGDLTRHDYYTISYAITTIINEWRTYVCNQRE